MKRDMDLIHFLLLETEGEEPRRDLAGSAEQQQIYHFALLFEAGLIDGVIQTDGSGFPSGTVRLRLTCAGPEFLNAASNDTIWKKAIEKIKQSGIQVTISLVEELLKKLLKETLRRP